MLSIQHTILILVSCDPIVFEYHSPSKTNTNNIIPHIHIDEIKLHLKSLSFLFLSIPIDLRDLKTTQNSNI
jgi:hypothetical protein